MVTTKAKVRASCEEHAYSKALRDSFNEFLTVFKGFATLDMFISNKVFTIITNLYSYNPSIWKVVDFSIGWSSAPAHFFLESNG